jgi:hypothetical protein
MELKLEACMMLDSRAQAAGRVLGLGREQELCRK